MASRRWLRGQSDVTVSLSAPRPLTTLGASRSTGPFDEVRRVYGDFATALVSAAAENDANGPQIHLGERPTTLSVTQRNGRRRPDHAKQRAGTVAPARRCHAHGLLLFTPWEHYQSAGRSSSCIVQKIVAPRSIDGTAYGYPP